MKAEGASSYTGSKAKVYVPIIKLILERNYHPGASTIDFSLYDMRAAAAELGTVTRNPADAVYRMRSRTRSIS